MKHLGPEALAAPDQAIAMTPMDGLVIPADAAPLNDYMNTIASPAGTIASFHVPSYRYGNRGNYGDKVSMVVQDVPKGKGKQLVVTTTNQQGNVTVRELPFKTPGNWRFGDFEDTNAFGYQIGILPPAEKGAQPSISLTFSERKERYSGSGEPNFPNVAVNGKAEIVKTSRSEVEAAHAAEVANTKGHEKKASRIRRALVVGAVALTYLLLSSGGIEDKVKDSKVDAGIVLETNLKPGLDSPFFPKQKKAEYQTAIDDVARTAHDLDEHDTAAIEARAEKFVHDNKDQFIGAEKSGEFLKSLDQAKSIDEIVTITGAFTAFYGKKTGLLKEQAGEHMGAFDPDTSVDDLRWMAKELVSTLSPLPKKLIEEGEFSSFQFGNSGNSAAYRAPYTRDFKQIEGIVALPTPGITARSLLRASRVTNPDFMVQGAKLSLSIVHEIGHSWQEKKDRLGGDVNELWQKQPDTEREGSFAFFLRGLINRPENISVYGTEYQERYPEQFGVLFDFSADALPHPDEVALYGSKPNMAIQAMLVDLEVNLGMPGLSDYIAVQNLTGRSPLRVGHQQFGSSWLRGA